VSPRLLLIVAAVLFSTGGVAIKYNNLTAWQVACSRSILAAAVLWVALPGTRRRWTMPLFAVGCAYAVMMILFVWSTKLTTSANAIFLQSTAPLYLLFIGPIFLKEPIYRRDWILLLAMLAGMSLFFAGVEPTLATAPDPALGNVLAAVSGLAWALVVAGLRWMGRNDPSGDAGIATVFIGNIIGFAIALGPAMPFVNVKLTDVLVVTYLGACQIALAYICFAKGMPHVRAFEAAAILLVEPALNPIWTWWILGERPSTLATAGGTILLLATAANAWWQRRI